MNENTIRKIFGKTFNGETNFMTPNIVRFGQVGVYIYELSNTGSSGGIFDNMYGVTVLRHDGSTTELSRSFSSKSAAENYIANSFNVGEEDGEQQD